MVSGPPEPVARQGVTLRVAKPKSPDLARLERVIAVLAEAGEDADTKRWVEGIYDQAMALRRMARGT